MSVPPIKQPSDSTPSRGRVDDRDRRGGKDFKLPGRKAELEKKKEKDEEEKQKGLFDLAAESAGNKLPDLMTGKQGEELETKSISAMPPATQVQQIGQLIRNMVDTLHVGQIGGQDFATLNLSDTPRVPQAFAGSQLTLLHQPNGLTIHFDNFMSPQQHADAISLIEKNKEQLQEMIQALNAKNIQVAELTLGAYTVNLPRIVPLPSPIEALSINTAETQQEKEGRDEQGEGDQGHPE